jgi:ATP/maltotriose-dependent transcriptional regulator MalT
MTLRAGSDTPDDEAADDRQLKVEPGDLAAVVAEVASRDGWRAAAAVIETHWDRLATTSPQHLLAAIRALPGAAFVDRPTFLVAANYLQHVVIGTDPSRFNHDGWLDATMSGGDIGLMDTLGLLTARSAGARTSGDMAAARRAAEDARTALENADEPERAAVRSSLPHYRLQWGRSLELSDAPGADFEYEEAYELALLTKQSSVGRRAAAQRAWLCAERGRMRAAELWLARALDSPGTDGRYDAVAFLTDALLRLDRGDVDGAGRELARTTGLGDTEYWAAVLWVQSMHARDAAAAATIDARLTHQVDRRPDTLTASGANGRYVRAARVRLSALRSRTAKEPIADPTLSATDRIIAGALAHGAGKHHDALGIVRSAAEPGEPPRTQTAALLITAAAALNLHHTEVATSAFVQAHALIEHEGLHTSYECIPSDDLHALASITSRTLPNLHSSFRPRNENHIGLSNREHEVLTLIAQGRSTVEIAAALFISPNTVKSTTRRLYKKLDATSRGTAVNAAQRSGLL